MLKKKNKRYSGVVTMLFLSTFSFYAQNLVPNYSFEDHTDCPTIIAPLSNEVSKSAPWYKATDGSPDYFHSCGANNTVQTPLNQQGYQIPRTGDGYIGLISYSDPNVYGVWTEYIQAPLPTQLDSGATYCAGFYASLADASTFSNDKLGMLFSTKKVGNVTNSIPYNANPILLNPQVSSEPQQLINDTTEWVLITNTFVADSAYKYVTIGNFNNNLNTYVQPFVSNWTFTDNVAYYFIDDVFAYRSLDDLETIEDTSMYAGDSLILSAGSFGTSFLWSTTETTSNITISDSGLYSVTINNGDCFSATKTIHVSFKEMDVLSIKIPNIITPNNDGLNDFFLIEGIEHFQENQLTIYDRWGAKVEEFTGYTNNWNANGLIDGVYYYVFYASMVASLPQTGFVTVLR